MATDGHGVAVVSRQSRIVFSTCVPLVDGLLDRVCPGLLPCRTRARIPTHKVVVAQIPCWPLIGDRHKGHFAPLGARTDNERPGAHLHIICCLRTPFRPAPMPDPTCVACVGTEPQLPDSPASPARLAPDMTRQVRGGGRGKLSLEGERARGNRTRTRTRTRRRERGVTNPRRALWFSRSMPFDEGVRTGPNPDGGPMTPCFLAPQYLDMGTPDPHTTWPSPNARRRFCWAALAACQTRALGGTGEQEGDEGCCCELQHRYPHLIHSRSNPPAPALSARPSVSQEINRLGQGATHTHTHVHKLTHTPLCKI